MPYYWKNLKFGASFILANEIQNFAALYSNAIGRALQLFLVEKCCASVLIFYLYWEGEFVRMVIILI